MDAVRPGPRMRRKSSAARIPKLFEADASEPFDPSDAASLASFRTAGPGSSSSSIHSTSSIAPGALRVQDVVAKRIAGWNELKQVFQSRRHCFDSVLLTRDELNHAFEHNRMRARTTRFAVLGMSLASLLENPSAPDFLKALLGLLQEFESVQDDRFDRKQSNRLSRASGKGKKAATSSTVDYSIVIQDSGDASFLFTPNVPFELDFFQVLYTLCDILIDTYRKILTFAGPASASAAPEGFPQPPSSAAGGSSLTAALLEALTKVDGKLKKLSTLLNKELEAIAKESIKRELSTLSGGVDWGMEAPVEG